MSPWVISLSRCALSLTVPRLLVTSYTTLTSSTLWPMDLGLNSGPSSLQSIVNWTCCSMIFSTWLSRKNCFWKNQFQIHRHRWLQHLWPGTHLDLDLDHFTIAMHPIGKPDRDGRNHCLQLWFINYVINLVILQRSAERTWKHWQQLKIRLLTLKAIGY